MTPPTPRPARPFSRADHVILCDQEIKRANDGVQRVLALVASSRAESVQTDLTIAGEAHETGADADRVVRHLRTALADARRLQTDLEQAIAHAEWLAAARPREMAVRA